MKKNHIWIGSFPDEEKFEAYINQERYLKAWSIYDNELPTGNLEEDKEPSDELRCQFCKDIFIDNYDEDFLIMKYKKGILLSDFLSLIPANPKELINNEKINNIDNINSLIIIDSDSLDEDASPENSSKLIYLGEFDEVHNIKNTPTDIQYNIWIGKTNKQKDEFISYFSGGAKKSKFSKETNIKKYNPLSVKWYYSSTSMSVDNLINQFIPNEIANSVIKKTKNKVGENANAIFFYISNEYKENEPARIILKEFAEEYPVPPKFQIEKDNYNDLMFIGSFKHEY
ncbi:immunity 22 family protein [Cellulophaga lytica]|uniref:immunity 22 family protein n=1 Tax=Cellulophaga lytica TaxID=979 RepID=UPI0026E3F9D1|nr:immunity 22 family protein [Cellulophaga lytica]MDO6853840.1 immunity 22 family protein [Cellulophaga lytica]